MFEYIKGILHEVLTEYIVVDVGGIGYELLVPHSTQQQLPQKNETVMLFVHFYVREDTQRLYGFMTRAEREVFRRLLTVSKIGPKVALNVLSHVTVKDIVYAVQTANASKLKAVSGIGPKTAERLVIELKDKLNFSVPDISLPSKKGTEKEIFSPTSRDDAFAAMVSLGYSDSQVQNALKRVDQTTSPEAPVEEWIKKALKVI